MARILDWPPVWLIAALSIVWMLDRVAGAGFFGPAGHRVGTFIMLAGFALMGIAVVQMMLARTTFIPRADPSALVTGGIFRLSRNPIYLGDALVLAGVILRLDVPLALPLVLIFMAVIQRRFILAEEAKLRIHFGPQFDAWAARTRRWI